MSSVTASGDTAIPAATSDLHLRGRRPAGQALRLLAIQVRAEIRANLRVPEFMVGAVSVPVILYAMFGLPNVGEHLPGGTAVTAMMMASFGAYGIISLAIFTFGIDTALERGKGWLRTRRVTTLPAWVYFAGKIAMGLFYSLVIIAALTVLAITMGDVSLPTMTWLRLWATLLSGAVVFSTFGFAIAYLVRPRAASTIGNLLFLPLSFASGLFFPLGELPAFLSTLAPWLPTYHYAMAVWSQLAPAADVAFWVGGDTGSLWPHVAWMAGSFLLFGVLAIAGYRRDGDLTLE